MNTGRRVENIPTTIEACDVRIAELKANLTTLQEMLSGYRSGTYAHADGSDWYRRASASFGHIQRDLGHVNGHRKTLVRQREDAHIAAKAEKVATRVETIARAREYKQSQHYLDVQDMKARVQVAVDFVRERYPDAVDDLIERLREKKAEQNKAGA